MGDDNVSANIDAQVMDRNTPPAFSDITMQLRFVQPCFGLFDGCETRYLNVKNGMATEGLYKCCDLIELSKEQYQVAQISPIHNLRFHPGFICCPPVCGGQHSTLTFKVVEGSNSNRTSKRVGTIEVGGVSNGLQVLRRALAAGDNAEYRAIKVRFGVLDACCIPLCGIFYPEPTTILFPRKKIILEQQQACCYMSVLDIFKISSDDDDIFTEKRPGCTGGLGCGLCDRYDNVTVNVVQSPFTMTKTGQVQIKRLENGFSLSERLIGSTSTPVGPQATYSEVPRALPTAVPVVPTAVPVVPDVVPGRL